MPAFELLGHQVSALYRMMLFDVRGADAETAAAEPLLRRLSLRPASTLHDLWLALRLLAAGRLVEAEEAYERSLADQRQLGFFGTEALTEVIRAMLNTLGGRWDAVTERLDALAMVAPLFAQSLRVWTLAEAGRVDEARAMLEADAPAALKDWSEIPVLAVAAQAAVAAGHKPRMHWYYEHLLPYSGWLAVGGNTIVFGPVDYYLAQLASALGDDEAGAEHRLRAESDCRAAGLMWWAERCAALAKSSATSRPQVVR
jgi:tetratricopeptide (TPR) repeat protein